MGGLMGLHKESSKNNPISFEDYFTNKKEDNPKVLEKKSSMQNLEIKANKDDDN